MPSMIVRYCLMWILMGLCASWATAAEEVDFLSARPIWPEGRETEMNLLVGFRAVVDVPAGTRATLRVAAATVYRVWVNGQFVGYGPARGPHGHFRVDVWDLAGKLVPGKNLVALEVAGYNCNSFYLLDQPSFLQAEVVSDGKTLASTAGGGEQFAAGILDSRAQKVQRYSFMRTFVEVYRLSPDTDAWRRNVSATMPVVKTAVLPPKKLLPRRVLYPEFAQLRPVKHLTTGHIDPVAKVETPWKDRSLDNIGPLLKGFPENQFATFVSREAQKHRYVQTARIDRPCAVADKIHLPAGGYELLDMGVNHTGFLGAHVKCSEKSRLWFVFDEILSGDDVDFKRMECVNVVSYELAPGEYDVESIEPYTLRYLKLVCLEGQCDVTGVYHREYAHPPTRGARFACSDDRLNRLYAAGVETFRQNSVDLFMDCPSRERGGYLCDAFFTARAAFDLDGSPRVEYNFFENYLLPERFAHIPDGMLPMCYPSDHYDGLFIPNWAMWFVVQLDEFAARNGDQDLVGRLRPKVTRLFEYLKPFENEDGLLEKLPGWVFVEWSKANDFVQDVNYPTNMLYAGALAAAGRIYQVPPWTAKAERIRETIRQQAFDGQFFVDNAVRRNGKLEVTQNHSEVCQYFAFFFGVATPETHAKLWHVLRDEFGPERQKNKKYAEVHPANSFIGNMLRMELLSREGRGQQILDESIAYLLYMADRTGTLWENVGPTASCNHGFASHIVYTLDRDVLGVRSIDPRRKEVALQFGALQLEWCEGVLPTPDGPVALHWRQDNKRIVYRVTVPAGYTVKIRNLSGKTLVATP